MPRSQLDHNRDYCPFIVTLPQYNMGYNFPPGLSHSHYRLCFAFRHILGITGRPLLQWPHTLYPKVVHNNLPIYAMQSSSMLRSCFRAQYFEGLVPPLAVIGPLLKQTLGSLNALLHPSSVHHITDICVGVMHWVTSCIVKSRPISHSILRVDSANSIYKCNLLAWNELDFKIIQLYCKLYSYRTGWCIW